MIKVYDMNGFVGWFHARAHRDSESIEVDLGGELQVLEVLKSEDKVKKGEQTLTFHNMRLFAQEINPKLWAHGQFSLNGDVVSRNVANV